MKITKNLKIKKYRKLLIIFGIIVLLFDLIISPSILNYYKGNVQTKEVLYYIYLLMSVVCCYLSFILSNLIYENIIIASIATIVVLGLAWSQNELGFFAIVLCIILIAGDHKK